MNNFLFQDLCVMTISTCLMVNDFRNAYLLLKNFYRSVSIFCGPVVHTYLYNHKICFDLKLIWTKSCISHV